MSWYTAEARRNGTIDVTIHGIAHALSKCTLPEGNYSITTLGASLRHAMRAHSPIAPEDGTHPKRLVPHASLVNNTSSIYSNSHPFEFLTDEHAVALMYMGFYTAQIAVCSVNDMLHNTVFRLFQSTNILHQVMFILHLSAIYS